MHGSIVAMQQIHPILLASFVEAGVKVHGSEAVTFQCRAKFNTDGGINYGMPIW